VGYDIFVPFVCCLSACVSTWHICYFFSRTVDIFQPNLIKKIIYFSVRFLLVWFFLDFGLRFVDRSANQSGEVEFYKNGTWNALCTHTRSGGPQGPFIVDVICRQLGLPTWVKQNETKYIDAYHCYCSNLFHFICKLFASLSACIGEFMPSQDVDNVFVSTYDNGNISVLTNLKQM
jgi:hypothetical protein